MCHGWSLKWGGGFFFQHKTMGDFLFYSFYGSCREKWNAEMDRQMGTRKVTISNALPFSLLHFVPGNGPAPVLALFLWSVISYMHCSVFKTTVSGSRESLALCARIFPASKRICAHWGLPYKKWQSSSPALLHMAYLCRSTFSPKLRILALQLRTTGLLCSSKNGNPQIKIIILNTMIYYFIRDHVISAFEVNVIQTVKQ